MITIKPAQNYDCDVLIAGGGPAGSGLAWHLAGKGWKVVVAEREEYPRDKVCGDGVSPVALGELHAMGITKTDKFAAANEISKVGIFIAGDKVFIDLSKPEHLPFHARIIPRIELDHWIHEAAKEQGAIYKENTSVTGYHATAGGVTVRLKGKTESTIRAKVVVGADGSNSCIYRQLNGAKPADEFQLLGLRAYYDNVNGPTDRVDIFLSGESFPGIYWMFPKGKSGANIGMAMVSSTLPKSNTHVRNMLRNYISNNADMAQRIGKGKLTDKISGWPLTFFNAAGKICAERVVLVGDAAGLINPLSGDGIQYALLSSRWAAEVIDDALGRNDLSAASLQRYRDKVEDKLGYDFALSNLLVQFARNKSLNAVWMEILKTMVSRAKTDKEYADIIAGIFEGNYPSYKALNASFILKSLLQGGENLGKGVITTITDNPAGAIHAGLQLSQKAIEVVEGIISQPREQGNWLKSTAKITLALAGRLVK